MGDVETLGINDKLARAEEKIKNNNWDIEAWNILLQDAQTKPIEENRQFYEKLVNQFPLSVEYVLSFILAEKKSKNYDNVDKMFKEYLPKIYNIKLWKKYLSYIKEKDDQTIGFKEKVAKAYDFASEHMGLDILSYPMWCDYINFLKSAVAKNQYAESQKTAAIRRVYHRAIVTPMIDIDIVWREYNTYENSINNVIARRFIEERSRDYMNARRVTEEYKVITKGLNRNLHSVPPQNTIEENKQVVIWKKYIDWEKANPLNTDDQLTITKRVIFAYEQCLLCLGYHPDIWYEAAIYAEEASKLLSGKGYQENANRYADKASEIYQRATSILKNNLLLGFAFADYEETRCKFSKVEAIYNKMINVADSDPTLVYIQYSRFLRRSKGILAARALFNQAREDSRTSHHIYINAAFMEHFCSKDNKVAHRLFELGIKKYINNPEMVLSYVDYLNFMNQDNYTRVLFERVFGSGKMSHKPAQPIWDKYLQFESYVGDLGNILKVERRRLESDVSKNSTNDVMSTARVVDRYKFGNLFPCSQSELRAMGYNQEQRVNVLSSCHSTDLSNSISVALSNGGISGNTKFSADSDNSKNSALPRPDFAHMLPFKPKAFCRTGSHSVDGTEFPPPPSISQIISLLPPPSSYMGPFVLCNSMIEHSIETKVPEWFAKLDPPENIPIDDGTALSIESAASQLLKKRRHNLVTVEKGEFFGNGSSEIKTNIPLIQTLNGPIVDVFKVRQQKRQKLSIGGGGLEKTSATDILIPTIENETKTWNK